MRAHWIAIAMLAGIGAWFVASGRAARALLACEILDGLRRPGAASWLERATPAPSVTPMTLESSRGAFVADLYRPSRAASRVPVVLVPGLVEGGKDDPRVAPFARLLARAGFTVVVPDLPSFRTLHVHPDQTHELTAALAAVLARRDLATAGRAGLFGISYAGGIALLAAADPELAPRVSFVAIAGGYADLDTSLRFIATGRTFFRGRMRLVKPDPYGQLVFVRTIGEFLEAPRDRDTLEAMIQLRMDSPGAPLADLARGLTPQGRLVYDLFEGGDPDRVPALIEALPAGLKARMAELSPARRDLGALRARLYIAHARDDGTFPASEARRLVELTRGTRDRPRRSPKPHLVVLEALQHVDPRPWSEDPWGFLARDLPEAARLAAWWYALLGER